MSLTSCYRYIIELPVDTLNTVLTAALSEDDSAGIAISQNWSNVPVGSYTADISVRPTDLDTNPPTMELTSTELGLVLHLRMRVEVDINEIEELETIVYTIGFDLPGVFEKDSSTPPRLLMRFPSVTAADLNLTVSGGDIPLSPELIEPSIHELYDADPSIGYDFQTNVPWPDEPTGVGVITEIFDDEPGSPDFHGAITVEVSDDSSQITVVMPGHIKVFSLSQTYVDTDMTVRVEVDVTKDDAAGKICAKLGSVQQNDVEATFDDPSIYDSFIKPVLEAAVADKINGDGTSNADQCVDIPTQADMDNLISERIVEYAGNIDIPIFTPAEPAADEVDLTSFVATTINQQVLALQIAPLEDGTPCDTPDVFARTTGFSVAVATVEVNPMLESILAANRGDHHVQGYDMTVNPLTGTLCNPGDNGIARGHFWIEGTSHVSVDCWDDPDVDFWGPVYLIPETRPDGTLVFIADAGDFGADDPCCADVDPGDIAELIEGEQSTPVAFPTGFVGVGQVTWSVNDAEISRDGIVIHGSIQVTTLSSLHAAATRKTLYWYTEMAGGG